MKIKVTFEGWNMLRIEQVIKIPDSMHLRGPIELTRRQAQSLAKAIIAKWGGVQ